MSKRIDPYWYLKPMTKEQQELAKHIKVAKVKGNMVKEFEFWLESKEDKRGGE